MEGFLLFITRMHSAEGAEAAAAPGWEANLQGIEADAALLALLAEEAGKIRDALRLQARPIIDRWIAFGLKRNEMLKVAVLHAHAALLWRNISEAELTPDVAVSFLSSQLFLATRSRGYHGAEGEARKRLDPRAGGEGASLVPEEMLQLEMAAEVSLPPHTHAHAAFPTQLSAVLPVCCLFAVCCAAWFLRRREGLSAVLSGF